MKKSLILLLICLICGCSVTYKDYTSVNQKNNETVHEEKTTLINGVIVENTENGFHMETNENELMSVAFNVTKAEEYKIGDRIEITLQRELPRMQRYCAIEEGDKVEIVNRSAIAITAETAYLDQGEFTYTLTNLNEKPVYVSQFEIYESGTGALQLNNHTSDKRIEVIDEYHGTADLNGYTTLNEGKYYLMLNYYERLDSTEPLGNAALPIEVESEVMANRLCKIKTITPDYFIAAPIFYDKPEERDIEYRFVADLSGQINEGTGAEYAEEDNIDIVYDKRTLIYHEEGYYEINPISYQGQVPSGFGAALKPVIYLYPETETNFTVKLDYDGKLTTTYPTYKNGWHGIAKPDGTLIVDGHEYSYLFWEGIDNNVYDMSEGFVVKGEDSAAFLQKTLSKMGLLPKEYNEFIVYWLPQLEKNAYNLITFQQEAYSDHAVLTLDPKPDSMLRVFMVYQGLDTYKEIKEMEIIPFVRQGFTVVEWGGYELK